MADAPLRAAYEEADITPPLGGSMPGYFKDRQATGVLDPLKAKVLFLGQGDESVALVACDLIGMGAPLVARIREQVRKVAKAPPRHVWVHCTHTHTGGMLPRNDGFTSDAEEIYPDFYQGKVDEKWVGQLVEKTAEAVARAAEQAQEEKKLTLHEGREKTVAHYRRYVMKDGSVRTNPGRGNPNVVRPAGEIDPRVHVVRFADRRILAVAYGVHPDTVGGTKYSADYPHHLTEVLRHALGAEWRVIFLNACCGNINHIDVNDPNQKSGPEEAKRIGETLAMAVLEALKKEQALPAGPLRAKTKEVSCTLRKPKPEDVKEAEELLRTYKETGKNPFGFNELYAPAALVLAKTKDREHKAEVAALRLASVGLAFLPGEIFVELGREVEDAAPLGPTRTVGLTNGAMGYIPTRRGFAEGGYEAGYRSARYEPETGHDWAKAAAEMLKEMAR
jgi:neutral ceramidase